MQRIALIVLILAGCGGGGGTPPPDAPPHAPDAAPAVPSLTDLTGGGRMTGGTLVVDLQVGHGIARTPTAGGSVIADPAAPIKP